ncbi:hypothetical protein L2E82_09890 [Cichorium intybus]|uniref:Uncharacterized protein n=1 Tax=Cichorium intybus TaxID=13427 RepID=A0ACB9GAF8_CICIN|nr:hypothetical protein L2E82_09890 [Cichorium intybus]
MSTTSKRRKSPITSFTFFLLRLDAMNAEAFEETGIKESGVSFDNKIDATNLTNITVLDKIQTSRILLRDPTVSNASTNLHHTNKSLCWDNVLGEPFSKYHPKFLKNKIKPEERNTFHFFNSLFFRKLADPDQDLLDASKGKAAFQRVKIWTRKVNLFQKDYIFIPVNYNYHWSLIVICHPGDVATYNVPCVLHMDSIRGSHTGLKGLLQSYLKEEWKERNQEASEEICSRFDNLRFISLELPQQQNSYDCGLFLLHYVELFLKEAPQHFNPFEITQNFNFVSINSKFH